MIEDQYVFAPVFAKHVNVHRPSKSFFANYGIKNMLPLFHLNINGVYEIIICNLSTMHFHICTIAIMAYTLLEPIDNLHSSCSS